MPTPSIQNLRHMKNVGIFADVAAGSPSHSFKPFNLVYGFNGCGKTTLSRLVDSIGDGGLNPNLSEGSEFSFALSDGTIPSNASPQNAASRFLAVFNEDYVENTLTWKKGTARPIIYLGKEQSQLVEKLSDLETQEASAVSEEILRSSEWSSAQRLLETKCRNTARLITEELNLGRRYNAGNLRTDFEIRTYSANDKLSDDDRKRLKEVVNKSDLPNVIGAFSPPSGGDAVYDLVGKALASQVQEIAIAALQRRKDALGWAEQGTRLHRGEPECLFCGNQLPDSRFEQLEQALKAGFGEFANQISAATEEAERFREKCRQHKDVLAQATDPLPTFVSAFGKARKKLASELDTAISTADQWLRALSRKIANPDESLPVVRLTDGNWDSRIKKEFDQANQIVLANNDALSNFATEQQVASKKIKAHHLADHQAGYEDAVALDSETNSERKKAESKLANLRNEIVAIRAQLRTHGAAATELNRLLSSYLGHPNITLEAVEEGYQICRNGKASTKPLSEGEKTGVAFCYFVTSLASEGRRSTDLIVVLDDPISSLDTRAMTHVVSMIRKQFANFTQLFILTHNLDFMREMKKWLNKRHKEGSAEFLFIETGAIIYVTY